MRKNAKKQIAPSILSADFSRLGEEVRAVEKAGADWIHCDVMDGRFVPNITIGPVIIEAVRKSTNLPLDVHLMIAEPDRYLEDFAKAGASVLTVHQEACSHLHRSLMKIKDLGAKAGVSINPATPIDTLSEVLAIADLILVMTVNPGFGGQMFIEHCQSKVKQLNDLREKHGYHYLIEADGGISEKNASALSKSGCDVFVAGSAIFGTKSEKSYEKAISSIRKEIN